MESTVLGSRYELLERVGVGGMAVVYKAKDKMLNRFVAVKVLREEFKENEDFIRRFKIESQAAASLSHQNIVQIYDVGEEDGMQYIVMEFLEGDTLKKHIIDTHGIISKREAMNFSMQICRALEHAHSKYVVHRDIKPQNMVITESGKLKVTDFGIARAANNTTTVNDKSTMAVGSAHYLSPEQARGGYTDNRSDIYSFGVVMYELFCGKLPFDAEESVSVLMQHLHEEPVAPCEVNPDLPKGIEAIILKAMKKEQRLRYKDATEILEDLILVYQNPSIDVSLLNASKEDGTSSENKASSSSQPPKRQSSAKKHSVSKKKKKKKGASAGLIVVLSLFIIAAAMAAWFFMDVVKPLFFSGSKNEVEVPSLVGMQYEEALKEAAAASTDDVQFTIEVKSKEYSQEDAGIIIWQSPDGGGKIKSNRAIKVVISKGPVVVTLEDYSGKAYKTVKAELEKLGITVEVEEVSDPDGKEGNIQKQNPQAGTTLAEGETVTLYVFVETEKVIVPNVLKMDKKDAEILLTERGLIISDITEDTASDLPVDQISYQSLEANSRVPINSRITLKYSSGKNEPKEDEEPEEEEPKENPDDKKNEEDTPPEPDVPETKTVNVSLSNLTKNKTVRVRLVSDGKTFFEKDITTATGNATVALQTTKALSLDVYYDGIFIGTKEVSY